MIHMYMKPCNSLQYMENRIRSIEIIFLLKTHNSTITQLNLHKGTIHETETDNNNNNNKFNIE